MRSVRALSLLGLCTALAACGATAPSTGGDGAVDSGRDGSSSEGGVVLPDGSVVRPDVVTPGDDVIVPGEDGVSPGEDAVTPGEDAVTPGEDAVTPGEDAVTPGPDAVTPGEDVVTPGDDAAVMPDAVVDMDVPVTMPDVVTPPDAMTMPDVVTPERCTAGGLSDSCPAAAPGPCMPLTAGMDRTVAFAGTTNTLRSTCEGMMTGAGPDGLVPLVLTAASDVVLTARPTGGDAVVAALVPAAQCSAAAMNERGCANSSMAGAGGVATVRATGVPAGTYYVVLSSQMGNPAIVRAEVTPARPRLMGDVCASPVVVTPDGAPTTLSTMGFQNTPDHGTTCGSNGAGTFVDAVFSYTLTERRDVRVTVTGTGMGGIAAEVESTCGMRGSIAGQCGMGNTVTRTLRNQAPGTYYVIAEARPAGAIGTAPSIVTTVTTSAPTPPPAADTCPGTALPATGVATDTVGMLNADRLTTCFASGRDSVHTFVAPPAGRDVLVRVNAAQNGAETGMQVELGCPMPGMSMCIGGETGGQSAFARYSGLMPGATYSVFAATNATDGTLTTTALSIPAAMPTAVTGNDACMGAHTIPTTGGIFTGNTTMAGTDAMIPQCQVRCAGGRGVFYRLTLTERRRVLLSTRGSSFDTVLVVRRGDTCPGANTQTACSDDVFGNAAAVDAVFDPGTYWVWLGGCGGMAAGNYTLDAVLLAP